MILYGFECQGCKETFESLIKPWDPVICPHCHAKDCRRLLCAPKAIGMSGESKEMTRREGKRERLSHLYQRQGIKL